GREGQPLQIFANATDPENDALLFWVENLPTGARFNAERRSLDWTPDFESAGTYPDVTFVAVDPTGSGQQVRVTTTISIQPSSQPPTLKPIAPRTILEGQPIRIQLDAKDLDDDNLLFSSN